jgi:peptide/nickel transport system substrate-binding protein
MYALFNNKITQIFAIFLVAAAFFQPQPAYASHKDLKIGINQYPSTLNPYFDSMVAKSYVLGTVLRPVTLHGPDWLPACALCTEMPGYENGRAKKETRPDGHKGIAATYTLKPGLFWGDGVPVTAEDIVFAWRVAGHPKSGADNGQFFSQDIVTVTANNDNTFTIHFDKEKCDFSAIDDFYPLPEHLEKKIFEQDPATYAHRTLYNTAPTNPGLYFGPYKVAHVESGASITVDRNPYWTGKPPAFDSITFRAIENSSALTANLLSGDIDYIAGELGLLLDQAITFEKRLNAVRPGQYSTIYKPGLTFEHIDLALNTPAFQDLRVRQALMYGMNRQALNDVLFGGRQAAATGAVNPLDSVFTGDVKNYSYDPAAAENLLDAAGWTKDADGFRHDAKGRRLTLVLETTAGNKTRETVAQALQSDWKKIGIDVVLENTPPRVLFGETMRKRSFKGGVMYAWMSAPKSIPRTTLHSSMIPSPENSYSGQNYAGYASAKMDKIIDDLDIVCDAQKNKTLWNDLQKLYAEDLPALPLYYRSDSFIIPRWLTGIVPTGHLHPTTLWIENWSVTE